MNRFGIRQTAILVIPILVVAAVWFFSGQTSSSRGSERVGTVAKGEVAQRVTIAGNVIPERRTIIIAPYEGYIQKLFVKVGDKVKAGDPIVMVAVSLTTPERIFPVRAPYAGTVVQVPKFEGEFVKTDPAQFIARIDDLSR
ncbi:MAG TPA: biotin/lipoyl-containing protein, partial [Bdellovibrionales bacterium]|nr:biotin/lipoyl-containing protein [Bdellovibrionales bacterium]